MLADLKKFLLKGNVVDLAVAVVIGVAFGAVVSAFVDFIVNPIIAAIFGKPDISQVLSFTLRTSDEGNAVLSIGGFLQAVLDFAIIGTVLFFIVQAFNKLQAKRAAGDVPEDEAPEPSEEAAVLFQILEELKSQRA